MKTQKIETIRKKFPKEWLLIEVDKTDETTNTSISGRLLSHSSHRDEIYKKLMSVKSKLPILVDYAQHKFPKDVAVIFYLYA